MPVHPTPQSRRLGQVIPVNFSRVKRRPPFGTPKPKPKPKTGKTR